MKTILSACNFFFVDNVGSSHSRSWIYIGDRVIDSLSNSPRSMLCSEWFFLVFVN